MLKVIPYKTKQFFFVLIKLSIVVIGFYFIYNKLISNKELDFEVFLRFLSENERFSLKIVGFLMIFSIFNWFFEIIKWRFLVSSIKKITFFQALEQSLGSLTASLLTPNRIGEYGVKAMYYKRKQRKKIVALNLLSNSLQMTVTTFLGLIGLYLFVTTYNTDINYLKVVSILGVLLASALLLYFTLSKKKISIKGISFKKIKRFYKNVATKTYLFGFLLSLIRYLIFSAQFYFLLYLFDVNMSYLNAMIIITSMYFLASVIPSIFIFDVVIKGSVAVYLFTIAGVNTITILSIVTLMWLLNMVLPSLIGGFYVLKFKLPKEIL